MATEEMGLDPHTGLQEEMHPLMMQSFWALKGKRNDPDLPSAMESVNGPHAEEFWKAMDAKIAGLEAKQAWEVVERSKHSRQHESNPQNMGPENQTETFKRSQQVQESLGLLR